MLLKRGHVHVPLDRPFRSAIAQLLPLRLGIASGGGQSGGGETPMNV